MSSAVLDTSAVLAWLREEHGGDRVVSLVDRACLSVAARLGLPAVTALRPANCWLLASSGISVRRSERSSARQLIR